jgi:hypothetical protein
VALSVKKLGYVSSWADADSVDLVAVARPKPQQRVVGAFVNDASPALVQLVVATPGSRGYEPRSRQGYAPTQWDTRDSSPRNLLPLLKFSSISNRRRPGFP